MTIYEIVTSKISNPNIPVLDIEMGIAEIEQAIKNYCLIPEVPAALYFTAANMAIDLINYTYAQTHAETDSETLGTGGLTSIRMGDTTLSFNPSSPSSERGKILAGHNPKLDTLIMDYRSQLNQFRRIW